MGKTNTPEELERLQKEQQKLAVEYNNLVKTDIMAALKLRPQVLELANKIENLKKKLNGSPPPGPVVAVAESVAGFDGIMEVKAEINPPTFVGT